VRKFIPKPGIDPQNINKYLQKSLAMSVARLFVNEK
jgi:hypothetical protein